MILCCSVVKVAQSVRCTKMDFSIAETIAFHTVLTAYDTITDESAVLFNNVVLNQGEG